MGRRCEEASMANSISLSPDNGSLWLSDGIAADPTLAPGLLFQSRSWKTSHSRNYAQSRSALGAKLLKLSLLSVFFFDLSYLLPGTGNPFRVHWTGTSCPRLSEGDKLWHYPSLKR